jgi:serine/threonine protein kinase
MSFNTGENVGPYRIVEQLGQGGMATVYKAYHAALDRYVAVKALHPAFGEDPSFLVRFQREARLVAKLEHPNIVPVYDYAEHENRPYLVMKFIEGDTLKARLNQGPLTSDEINKVVDAVGAGLGYAHKQGVLHRDIKPSNVLLAKDGQIYLADFGLARIAQSGESTLSSDMIMGTPQYISPEQAMGKKDLDEGTDIYSFGVMLYEMVVGQVPFNADTPFSIIHDHIYSPLPMPRSINPKVPETVERVLLKGLAKERADRYATVGDFVKAFKQAWVDAGVPMQGTAITMQPKPGAAENAKQDGATVAAKKSGTKKRSPWPLIATGVLLLICLAVVFFAVRGSGFFKPAKTIHTPTSQPVATLASTAFVVPGTAASATANTPAVSPTSPLPAAVAAALDLVNQNPNDPNAYLQLSLAYLDNKDSPNALLNLANAAKLAQPDDTNFFQNAGDQFRQRQAWVGAAAMYFRAIKSYGLTQKVPQDLIDNYHEAIYKAAVLPEISAYLPFDSLGSFEQPMAQVAQARHEYYNGQEADARALLNQVKRVRPHMPEAILLEAEMLAKEGDSFHAKQNLNILLADINTPDWVRESAQELLNKIP